MIAMRIPAAGIGSRISCVGRRHPDVEGKTSISRSGVTTAVSCDFSAAEDIYIGKDFTTTTDF